MQNQIIFKCASALLVLLCLLLDVGLCSAATLDDVSRGAARIIQQQQELQEQLQDDVRSRQRPIPEGLEILPPDMEKDVSSDRCYPVDVIEFEGVSLMPLGDLENLANPFIGECVSLKEINAILREITILYFDAGFITSRPYIKPQDLADGSLLVTVVEGHIEDISYEDVPQETDRSIRFAFPTSAGAFLNLRDLEQGLDQLNRLQSNSVRLNLVPGVKPGSTSVFLENNLADRTNYSISIDNNGSESTGEIQGHAAVGVDNFFGVADYFGLTFSHDFHRNTGKDSRNFFVRYEVPYGWNLFGFSYNHFNYKQTVEGVGQTFPATGRTRSFSMFADRVLVRDRTRKLSFGLALDWKDERNYLLDVMLDTSSQDFVVGRSTLKLDWYFERASLQMVVGYHRGLNILHTQDDATAPNGTPQTQFGKWSTDISCQSAIASVPGLSYRGRVFGQYSADRMFPSEQVRIGSLYSVRGYKLEGYSGNSGGYIRNEIAYSFAGVPLLQKVGLAKVEPFVGADWGSVKVEFSDDDGYENLQSWTVGLKMFGLNQSMNLSYSHPVDRPVGFINSDGEFTFSYTIFF